MQSANATKPEAHRAVRAHGRQRGGAGEGVGAVALAAKAAAHHVLLALPGPKTAVFGC